MIIDIEYKDSIQHPAIFSDESSEVFIEDSTLGWIVHCYVKEWSKSIYWKLVDVLLAIKEVAPRGEIYCVAFNDKLVKFATMFGFESIDTLTEKATGKSGELMVYA